jgi:hypothetical protein
MGDWTLLAELCVKTPTHSVIPTPVGTQGVGRVAHRRSASQVALVQAFTANAVLQSSTPWAPIFIGVTRGAVASSHSTKFMPER